VLKAETKYSINITDKIWKVEKVTICNKTKVILQQTKTMLLSQTYGELASVSIKADVDRVLKV